MTAASNPSHAVRAHEIIRGEISGLEQLAETVDDAIPAAVALLAGTRGKVVVSGVGKSGLIGAKLASTFASTGTPSFFLHAAEAAHGDLGMITEEDIVLLVSNSGNSREIYPLLDFCQIHSIPLIAMCSRPESRLGKAANVLLRMPEVVEVCPNRLAPTTSATVTLVLGHVLAILLMEARSFGDSDFAELHPGGRLGLMLSTVRRYIDEYGDEVPMVPSDAPLETVITSLAAGRKGCVVVADAADSGSFGVITEGDLRRAYSPDMFAKTAKDIMTRNPSTVTPQDRMSDALLLMKSRRIANVLVVEDGKVVDVLHIKDLMQRGYF